MKKSVVLITVISLLLLLPVGVVSADQEGFTVSATVPSASGVTFKIAEILVDGDQWTNNNPDDLLFGTLEFDTTYKIFRPTRYFAIDIGVVEDGAGQPDNIQFTYDDLLNDPNSTAGNGRGALGKKATLKVVKGTLGDDVDVKDPVILDDVATLNTLHKSDFVDGWPRVYVGLYDGNDAALDAAGAEVFTAEDAPGDYVGTLTITAVVN